MNRLVWGTLGVLPVQVNGTGPISWGPPGVALLRIRSTVRDRSFCPFPGVCHRWPPRAVTPLRSERWNRDPDHATSARLGRTRVHGMGQWPQV